MVYYSGKLVSTKEERHVPQPVAVNEPEQLATHSAGTRRSLDLHARA
ncbi:hypothetical protein CVCC1112_63 [Paenarthrobacter nicotinovorans]|nr:hypothetical protein ANMWB30_35600 [Arthrobacter sp. MWB30]GAT85403.1 hypothetical protein CVCC1112_63 [Paenarthrobacter nicotinovorans]